MAQAAGTVDVTNIIRGQSVVLLAAKLFALQLARQAGRDVTFGNTFWIPVAPSRHVSQSKSVSASRCFLEQGSHRE